MAVLVSVVTPVYNSADSIAQVVSSVKNQCFKHYEHILVDNGSTDGSLELLQELSRDFTIQCLQQRQRGAGAARNLGIEAASGRYIAFLDSDDLWLPGKLESQISFMRQHDLAFSYGDYERRDRQSGGPIGTFIAPELVSYHDLLHGCPIGCLTAAYDQEALGKVYMPDVWRGQDWGLWLALTRLGGPARKYAGVHAVYHTGGNSLSANKLRKLRDIYAIYREQEHYGALRSGWYLAHHAMNAVLKAR